MCAGYVSQNGPGWLLLFTQQAESLGMQASTDPSAKLWLCPLKIGGVPVPCDPNRGRQIRFVFLRGVPRTLTLQDISRHLVAFFYDLLNDGKVANVSHWLIVISLMMNRARICRSSPFPPLPQRSNTTPTWVLWPRLRMYVGKCCGRQ